MTIIRESQRTLDTTKPKPRNAAQNKTRKEARFTQGNRSGLQGFTACAVASYVIDSATVYPRNNVQGIRWLRHDGISYRNDHFAQVSPVSWSCFISLVVGTVVTRQTFIGLPVFIPTTRHT